jgi:hypothetical protein
MVRRGAGPAVRGSEGGPPRGLSRGRKIVPPGPGGEWPDIFDQLLVGIRFVTLRDDPSAHVQAYAIDPDCPDDDPDQLAMTDQTICGRPGPFTGQDRVDPRCPDCWAGIVTALEQCRAVIAQRRAARRLPPGLLDGESP